MFSCDQPRTVTLLRSRPNDEQPAREFKLKTTSSLPLFDLAKAQLCCLVVAMTDLQGSRYHVLVGEKFYTRCSSWTWLSILGVPQQNTPVAKIELRKWQNAIMAKWELLDNTRAGAEL